MRINRNEDRLMRYPNKAMLPGTKFLLRDDDGNYEEHVLTACVELDGCILYSLLNRRSSKPLFDGYLPMISVLAYIDSRSANVGMGEVARRLEKIIYRGMYDRNTEGSSSDKEDYRPGSFKRAAYMFGFSNPCSPGREAEMTGELFSTFLRIHGY